MINLERHNCPNCFVEFALPDRMIAERRKDGKAFFCPAGHSMSFHDTEFDRLQRERDRLKQDNARLAEEAEIARKAAITAKAAATKARKRTVAGVCPCCTRSFTNLRRHIETQHPEETNKVVPIRARKK